MTLIITRSEREKEREGFSVYRFEVSQEPELNLRVANRG